MELESEKRGELSPLRLAEKLKRIRLDNGLTQGKMLLIINPTESDESNRARVSQYETGIRVPSLVETYNYARFAGVTVETLLNDNFDLPATIQQSNSDDSKDAQLLVGREAKNFEIKNGNDSLDDEDNPLVENKSEPEGDSSSEPCAVEQSQVQGDMSNIDRSSSSAAIYSIRISEEISDDSKALFLKLLGELPFNQMERITPEKFLEQAIAAALDDHHARKTESALARRMQLLFEDEG